MSVPDRTSWPIDVIAHMEASLRRGGSIYSVGDLVRLLAQGRLGLAIGQSMSGSWVRIPEEGRSEVGHLAGTWHEAEVRWIIRCMRRDLIAHGIDPQAWSWRGRRGWRRFLAMRGLDPWEVT